MQRFAVQFVLALVLLVAAGLKSYQLATEPSISPSSRLLDAIVVQIEVTLGCWLLSGWKRLLAWRIALVWFALLAIVSISRAILGSESCGCFGRIPVSPWLTSAFNIVAIAALVRWQPKGSSIEAVVASRPLYVRSLLCLWIVALPFTLALATQPPNTLMLDGVVKSASKPIVLQPTEWPGHRLPLLAYIDVGSTLTHGKWTLLFYHHDCARCQAALPAYCALAGQQAASGIDAKVALIQFPPYGPRPAIDSPAFHGRVDDSYQWLMDAPAEVHIDEGVVTSASLAPRDRRTPIEDL